MTDAAAPATDAATTTTDTPVDGVAYLLGKIEQARHMLVVTGAPSAAVDDVLLETLDVLTGHCVPRLRIQAAPQGVSYFAVRDSNGGVVVEYMPDRKHPYYAVDWSDDMQHAELVAALLNDNEQAPNRRTEITGGERLSVSE